MSLSIIIPTYKRPTDLMRVLNSIMNLTVKPDELIIVVGPKDTESVAICEEWSKKFERTTILMAQKGSLIHALNTGLTIASKDIICFLDDDVSLPEDWSIKIINAYKNNDKLGAFGGRDRLQLGDPRLDNPPLAKVVGTYTWDGRFFGNHHCGVENSPALVDVIKGANFSFRKIAFPQMKIDPNLENQGAEPCSEIDICLTIKKAGYQVVYDNDNYLLHFIGTRAGNDNRTDLFSSLIPSRIFNESFVMGKFRSKFEVAVFFCRSLLVGTKARPGVLRTVFLVKQYGLKVLSLPFTNIVYVLKGIKKGLAVRKESFQQVRSK